MIPWIHQDNFCLGVFAFAVPSWNILTNIPVVWCLTFMRSLPQCHLHKDFSDYMLKIRFLWDILPFWPSFIFQPKQEDVKQGNKKWPAQSLLLHPLPWSSLLISNSDFCYSSDLSSLSMPQSLCTCSSSCFISTSIALHWSGLCSNVSPLEIFFFYLNKTALSDIAPPSLAILLLSITFTILNMT